MITEYRKNLNRSVMITTLDAPELGYEIDMLKNNEIHGLLPFEIIAENGEWKTLHDITGQQSLDAWMDTQQMDTGFFRELIRSVDGICREFEPYLLDEDKLCLSPDHIFVKNGTRELSFSYIPETGKAVTDSFRELLEYLLTRIDHHDEILVKEAYAAYEKTGETGYSIHGLMREPPLEEKRDIIQEDQAEPMEVLFEGEDDDHEEIYIPKPPKKERSLKKRLSFLERMRRPVLMDYEEEEEPEPLPEPKEEIFEEATTYLNPNMDYCKGILKYVGSGEEGDIRITAAPFFIGTRVGIGGKLKSTAVSRLHAKISRAGEVYLLEDLNSMNGTFVNEKELSYKSPVTLHPKDQIRFADEEFVFL